MMKESVKNYVAVKKKFGKNLSFFVDKTNCNHGFFCNQKPTVKRRGENQTCNLEFRKVDLVKLMIVEQIGMY